MTNFYEIAKLAFPAGVRELVELVTCRLPPSKIPPGPTAVGPIVIDGEVISIPARIYFDTIPLDVYGLVASPERRIVTCLYTRHHDGYVRERSLEALLPVRHIWEVPFVIQLIGEYVVEIVELIQNGLTCEQEPLFSRFVRENTKFLELTRQRAISYWDCYHRSRWWRLVDYPRTQALTRLESWANSQAADDGQQSR